jgi:hypothetical protein
VCTCKTGPLTNHDKAQAQSVAIGVHSSDDSYRSDIDNGYKTADGHRVSATWGKTLNFKVLNKRTTSNYSLYTELAQLVATFPEKQWLMLVDAHSLVVPRNLIERLNVLNPTRPVLIQSQPHAVLLSRLLYDQLLERSKQDTANSFDVLIERLAGDRTGVNIVDTAFTSQQQQHNLQEGQCVPAVVVPLAPDVATLKPEFKLTEEVSRLSVAHYLLKGGDHRSGCHAHIT